MRVTGAGPVRVISLGRGWDYPARCAVSWNQSRTGRLVTGIAPVTLTEPVHDRFGTLWKTKMTVCLGLELCGKQSKDDSGWWSSSLKVNSQATMQSCQACNPPRFALCSSPSRAALLSDSRFASPWDAVASILTLPYHSYPPPLSPPPTPASLRPRMKLSPRLHHRRNFDRLGRP